MQSDGCLPRLRVQAYDPSRTQILNLHLSEARQRLKLLASRSSAIDALTLTYALDTLCSFSDSAFAQARDPKVEMRSPLPSLLP